ncbi:TetR/AcrR family transcriptional regulator [Leuconostoc suionicum]|uniref:TetR/AcrR family transcriptional regulator n=1 Tax=Leuconostoc suionicum TaxID=1511761 RepID=UPI00403641DB
MNVRIFKTTNTIYETFKTLLREKNFDKISVNEICKKSLISKSTFYAHFADKYDLLEHFSDKTTSILEEIIRRRFKAMDYQNPFSILDKIANDTVSQNKDIQLLLKLNSPEFQFEKSLQQILYENCFKWLEKSNKKLKFTKDFTALLYSNIALSSIKFSLEISEKEPEYLKNHIAFISSMQNSILGTIFLSE